MITRTAGRKWLARRRLYLALGPILLAGFLAGAVVFSQQEVQATRLAPHPASPAAGPPPVLALLRARRSGEAIAACLESIERNSADLTAYAWLWQALDQLKGPSATAAVLKTAQFLDRLAREHPADSHYRYGLGVAYRMQRNLPLARRRFKESISLGADFWEVYEELANSYLARADIDDTADFLRSGLMQNPSGAYLHQALGLVHYYSSEYRDARVSLERALALFQERQNAEAEGRCRLNLSDVFTYLNDYPGALAEAQAGLRISSESGDKVLEILCLERSAFIWTDRGNDVKAYDACVRALALSREIVCRRLEVLCLRTMGVIFLERGDLAKAQDFLSRALAYYRDTEALRSQDICLYWLTLLYEDRGDYSKAMGCAREALQISRQIGFKTGEAFHLTTIGDIYLALGEYDRALEYNREALIVAEQYIGKWSREECLNTIGRVYVELNDYRRAMESFTEALNYVRRIGHRREEARCLYNVGLAYFKLGDDANALECFSKSLDAASSSGKRIIQADVYNRLGDLNRRRGFWDKSRDFYLRAQRVGREVGQPNAVWEAYVGLAALAVDRRDVPSAIENYKLAIGIIEDLRVQQLLREYSSGFFKSKIAIYEALVNLLYEEHLRGPAGETLEDCLYYAEKAKARSFLDDLQKAKIDIASLPAEKAAEWELISRRISRLSAALNDASLSPADQSDLRQRLEKAEDDYQLFAERLRIENPQYSRMVLSEPCRLPEIRRRLLDNETGIFEYFVGERNIYIFFITPRRLSARRLTPSESQRTLRLVNNYIRLLASKEITNSDVLPAGGKLGEVLMGAAGGGSLSGIKNLIVIPDRSLYYLPFEALVRRGGPGGVWAEARYLLEDFRISYAPSASTLVSILERGRNAPPAADLLSIGDPIIGRPGKVTDQVKGGKDVLHQYYLEKRFVLRPLKFASQEMESISKSISPRFRTIVSGGDATEARVKKLPLSEYKILHFATHSLLDEFVGSHSALVLTPDPRTDEDGFLQAREIYNLKSNADLVVLSACQTARGKMEKGEGIQGLSRAFFCSGSRSVLASLWNINDRSTSWFMKNFYDYLAQGKSKSEALRLTKIRMCHSRSWHPYHWGAFVLIGEGEGGISLRRPSFWARLLHQ
jgi:CHAT domain-containing protein/Tfp pilus assembly protein PilF